MQTLGVFYHLSVLTCALITVSHATIGGLRSQYQMSVYFVPALVRGNCQIATFWTPPNVPCGTCFCMTSTLSRCFPMHKCKSATITTTITPQSEEAATTGEEIAIETTLGSRDVTKGFSSRTPEATIVDSSSSVDTQEAENINEFETTTIINSKSSFNFKPNKDKRKRFSQK